jgi:ubiquinone/menaquinone biosynthesis C-methylase UbiE
MCTKNKLYKAPLNKDDIKKVLDVGTGTGIWAMQVATNQPMPSSHLLTLL